jgi:hypothetical protein
MPAHESSSYELLQQILASLEGVQINIGEVIAGGITPTTYGISQVELDESYPFGINLNPLSGDFIPAENVTIGTASLWRIRDDVTSVILNNIPATVASSHIIYDVPFNTSDGWQVGDVFFVLTGGGFIEETDGSHTVIGVRTILGRVTELPAIQTNVAVLRTLLEDGPDSLSTLHTLLSTIDSSVTVVDGKIVTLDGKVTTIDSLVDAIKAKTDNLPASPAATGDAMTLTAGAVAGVQAGLATSAALATTDGKVDDVKTLAEGASGFAGIKADTAATLALSEGASGFAAIKDQLGTIEGYADVLDHATNGNAALRGQLDAVVAALLNRRLRHGSVLLANPWEDASTSGWAVGSGWTLSREVAGYRSGTAALKATATGVPSGNTGFTATLAGKARAGARYFMECWVRTATEGLAVTAAISTTGNSGWKAVQTGVVLVANTWTRIMGVGTLTNADGGDLNVLVRAVAPATGDYLLLDDLIFVELDDSFDDYVFRQLSSKSSSIAFDRTTDSLEALRDRLDEVYGQAAAVADGKTVRAVYDKVAQQKIGRSSQSGSTTMTGSEQILYEQSDTTAWKFEGGWIDLSGLADTRSITLRFYVKLKSGGTYRLAGPEVVLTGTAGAGLYRCPQQLPVGGTTYKAVIPEFHNTYGVKVTAQQSVAGAGYLTIDHEWYDSKS